MAGTQEQKLPPGRPGLAGSRGAPRTLNLTVWYGMHSKPCHYHYTKHSCQDLDPHMFWHQGAFNTRHAQAVLHPHSVIFLVRGAVCQGCWASPYLGQWLHRRIHFDASQGRRQDPGKVETHVQVHRQEICIFLWIQESWHYSETIASSHSVSSDMFKITIWNHDPGSRSPWFC